MLIDHPDIRWPWDKKLEECKKAEAEAKAEAKARCQMPDSQIPDS